MEDPLLCDGQRGRQASTIDKCKEAVNSTCSVMAAHSKSIFIALGPLAALLILLFVRMDVPSATGAGGIDQSRKATKMLAALAWVCIWWVTEAIPVPITSLLPLFLLPMFQLADSDAVAMSYMNDTITIFIGSFILALAVEKYNVHSRLALKLLLFFGGSTMDPRWLLLGFCAGPAFVSMWISNTAAAVMMIPMSIGVLHKLESGHIAHLQAQALCPTCGAEDLQKLGSVTKGDIISQMLATDGVPSLQDVETQPQQQQQEEQQPEPRIPRKLSRRPSLFSRDLRLEALMAEEDIAKEVGHIANFGRAVVMGIAYSVSIGGLSTLTGTSTNMILSGMWNRQFPSAPPVTYSQWFLFAFPLAVGLLIFCWLLLWFRYCPPAAVPTISHSLNRSSIQDDYDSLGPVSFAESSVLLLFLVLAALWLTRKIGTLGGWGELFDGYAGDGTVSVLLAMLLFIIPNKVVPGEKLMDWASCKKLPWDIVLLLGGGFALAEGIATSGLSDWVTQHMGFLSSAHYLLVAPIAAIFVSIMTEFTSNNATATIFLPLLADVALSINVHPLYLMVTGTITASYAFMLPIATPPNAIAFSTNYLKVTDTITSGLVLKLFGIILISVLMPTLGTWVFSLNEPFGA